MNSLAAITGRLQESVTFCHSMSAGLINSNLKY